MHARTRVWFTATSKYATVTSPPVALRSEDIGPTVRKFSEATMGTYKAKKYGPQYLWGQMSFWDRQTIKSPDASLTAARYGTVSLPDVECCYRSTGKKYNRRGLLTLLREKAWQQWPGRWHWSFRNPSKVRVLCFVLVAVCGTESSCVSLLTASHPVSSRSVPLHATPPHTTTPHHHTTLPIPPHTAPHTKVYGSPMLDRFLGLPSMAELMQDLEAGSLCLAPAIGREKESGARASAKRKAGAAKRSERAKKRKTGAGKAGKGGKGKGKGKRKGDEGAAEAKVE